MGFIGWVMRRWLACAASMPEMSVVGMPASARRCDSCATCALSRMPRPHRMCASAAAEYLRRAAAEMHGSPDSSAAHQTRILASSPPRLWRSAQPPCAPLVSQVVRDC